MSSSVRRTRPGRDATLGCASKYCPVRGGGRDSTAPTVPLGAMVPYEIRVIGDPVLKRRAEDVTDIDGALVQLTDDMIETMYAAPGAGLAAPQVGVEKRIFVYDLHDDTGPHVVINPEITEARGEYVFEE